VQRERAAPDPPARVVDVDAVPTHVVEAGSGPPMVLLHGGGPANCALMTWAPVLDGLAERFRVVAPDQLGFGLTVARTGDVDLHARVRHARRLLEQLDLGPATLVGHSQGGWVAMRLALLAPGLVDRLVVISSGTAAPMGNLAADATLSRALAGVMSFDSDPSFERFIGICEAWTAHPERLDRAWLERFYRQMRRTGTLEAFVRGTIEPFRGRPERLAALHDEFLAPRLAELAVPTLLVWGREDDFAPPAGGLRLAELLPGAHVVFVPGAKHMLMWDRPEALTRILSSFGTVALPS
jgi:pimeloyl-ACP methyl ester carboxylesterase